MYDGQIPFNEKNQLLHYARHGSGVVWKDNFEFEDSMAFCGFTRGRSAAHANVKSEKTGQVYTMFLKDLGDAIPYLKDGKLHGQFTFAKRGTNYGIKYIS